ncbi:MAG: hypothetical protein HY343_11610, partial [Lentisphaerae bacterium]|nr:hypothetical protein [Lentisphaerota bacterium]
MSQWRTTGIGNQGWLAHHSSRSDGGRLSGVGLAFLLVMAAALPARATDVFGWLEPGGAIINGAQWRMDGGIWRFSGESNSVSPGTHFIQCKPVVDYYAPPVMTVVVAGVTVHATNIYLPWTNTLSVTVDGDVDPTVAQWILSLSPTNFGKYVSGIGNQYQLPTLCPTGRYSVTFTPVSGYNTPGIPPGAAISSNVYGAANGWITGRYTRITGTIVININTGAWICTTYPPDYSLFTTSSLSGNTTNGPTTIFTITNAPAGDYTFTFMDVDGYDTPADQTVTIGAGMNFVTATYLLGARLTVYIYKQGDAIDVNYTTNTTADDRYLQGIGTGTYSFSGATGVFYNGNWYFTPDAQVTLSASQTVTFVGGVEYDSFFYEWVVGSLPSETRSVTITMDTDKYVKLLFSRECYTNDNVGDLDADTLPTEWERAWLGPGADKDVSLNNGQYGNQDNDYIPSSLTNPPAVYNFNTVYISYYGTNQTTPGYPLLGTVLLTNSYNTGVKFLNQLECRGLDGFYKTNAAGGACPNDDPPTDPKSADSDNDTMPDGWEYYFWRWRSSDAYGLGLTNGANLPWVLIRPNGGGTLADYDTDEDGLVDGNEYVYGTDPTHADTDGDRLDDAWEIARGLNTRSPSEPNLNPDLDYYAVISGSSILTTGIVGTVFAAPVYSSKTGAETNFWLDANTNGVFDLYQDTVLMGFNLTNRVAGVAFTNPVMFGLSSNLLVFKQGLPVWVDSDNSGAYSSNDVTIVSWPLRNTYLYTMPPPEEFPGVSSFDPFTAWQNPAFPLTPHPNTQPYTTFLEYNGGDYVGRVSWDSGGRVMLPNNDDDLLKNANSWSDPVNPDSDGDSAYDGWELYVGMNPNDPLDGAVDENPGDKDGLLNAQEFSRTTATGATEFTLACDPGVLKAPAPNDPHPADTDWDGLGDGGDPNPSLPDTDLDGLPDGWESYAGSDPTVSDAYSDPDNDGLMNYQEYWTAAVPEWMLCDPSWNVAFNTRRAMPWVRTLYPDDPAYNPYMYIPPDFVTDPSFLYYNGVETNLATLRQQYPAAGAKGAAEYHSTRASGLGAEDCDRDGLDDYWEVYHGLNPTFGLISLWTPADYRSAAWFDGVGETDGDPDTPGYQLAYHSDLFDTTSPLVPLSSLIELVQYMKAAPYDMAVDSMAGPFKFGLELMDPDGDGLPNLEEYSYTQERAFYHTDPTPLWRTDSREPSSFVRQNYKFTPDGVNLATPYWSDIYGIYLFFSWGPFPYEEVDGFDTDNDGVSDYDEIVGANGILGTDSLNAFDPFRNRSLVLDGKDDFVRTPISWWTLDEGHLTKFTIEAWVKPDRPQYAEEQIVIEKAGLYRNPYQPTGEIVRANFRLGITTDGLPFITYNGRGALTNFTAVAQTGSRLLANVWSHIAGVYDGTWLTIYVNGQISRSIRSTEIPATGFNANSDFLFGSPQTIIVGARDLQPSVGIPGDILPVSFFKGCIDEVRVWNGVRSASDIMQNKARRMTWTDVNTGYSTPGDSNMITYLTSYYPFDDVPDPAIEGVVPRGLDRLDTNLLFHPTLVWQQDNEFRSNVYTGSPTQPYNIVVSIQDFAGHIASIPPSDDYFHTTTWSGTTNITNGGGSVFIISYTNLDLPDGYRNTSNPYNIWLDLFIARDAVVKAIYPSWLPTIGDTSDSVDIDGDNLPDNWEISHGLDPNDATGNNGAWGDPDNDGLNNRSEYLSGNDPWNADSNGDGLSDYDSQAGPGSRTWGEIYSDTDGMPDEWELANGLDPYSFDANLDKDGDGWSNLQEYWAGTNPQDADSSPNPTISGTYHYFGTNAGAFGIIAWQTNTMGGVPVPLSAGVSGNNFQISGFKEGDVYLLGYFDVNSDDAWTDSTDLGEGVEPAGLLENQPIHLSWGDVSGARIGLSDSLPGYSRFIWEPFDTSYSVALNRTSGAGSPQIMSFNIQWRWATFEWDMQRLGVYGLSAGTYEWRVGNERRQFTVAWPSSFVTPDLVSPRGDTWSTAHNMLVWTMDPYSTLYHLQVITPTRSYVDQYFVAPYRDENGQCRAYLPGYLTDWGAQTYFYRISSWCPSGESAWSEWQTFTVDLTTTAGSRYIGGDVYYFGKSKATNIVIEAFANPGFSGPAASRISLALPCITNALKGQFTLPGLEAKTYYVRGFVDVSPSGGTGRNGAMDYWEPFGFIKSGSGADYQPAALDLSNSLSISAQQLVLRERDTDNDRLPDGWEMSYFGNLAQTGEMDTDGDGDINLVEYAIDALDTDPTRWDTDGDRLNDRYERLYDGNEGYNPYDPVHTLTGTDLNPTRADTDGDGFSDGMEMRYHTNPLDPNSYPVNTLAGGGWSGVPADYDGDFRTDFGVFYPAGGLWYIYTRGGAFYQMAFGWADVWPMVGDYDGDSRTDLAVYYPAAGMWYIWTWNGQFYALQWGWPGAYPVPGDYDGDGRTDFAVYDFASGAWYILTWQGRFYAVGWGAPSLFPVPGDYDGDG